MSKVGYARVSSEDQSLNIQVCALKAAGCTKVFSDKASASNTKRTGLIQLLEYVREDDAIVITRIDRISRSVLDLKLLMAKLHSLKVHLSVLEQSIDTASASGRAFLDMLAVFAEFELNIRKERQLEGIAAAKKAGKYKGRKPLDNSIKEKAKELYSQIHNKSEVARVLNISRSSLHKLI
ncbi:DNA invertase [Shewanella sp. OPT22]|nr:DNA invertase [Shewanella sp. OPT22]